MSCNNCENCFYFGFCEWGNPIHICDDFLPKEKVVILPCKIGDMVYIVCGNQIYSYTIMDFTINDHIWVRLFNKEYCQEYQSAYRCLSWDLGKTIFLSLEEAKKQIKGGNKNA